VKAIQIVKLSLEGKLLLRGK